VGLLCPAQQVVEDFADARGEVGEIAVAFDAPEDESQIARREIDEARGRDAVGNMAVVVGVAHFAQMFECGWHKLHVRIDERHGAAAFFGEVWFIGQCVHGLDVDLIGKLVIEDGHGSFLSSFGYGNATMRPPVCTEDVHLARAQSVLSPA
jgi:hypothetical protein